MATTDRSDDIAALRKEIDSLKDDLKSLSGAARDAAKSEYDRDREAVREAAGAARGAVGETLDRHPEVALLSAFGVGLVVGLTARR